MKQIKLFFNDMINRHEKDIGDYIFCFFCEHDSKESGFCMNNCTNITRKVTNQLQHLFMVINSPVFDAVSEEIHKIEIVGDQNDQLKEGCLYFLNIIRKAVIHSNNCWLCSNCIDPSFCRGRRSPTPLCGYEDFEETIKQELDQLVKTILHPLFEEAFKIATELFNENESEDPKDFSEYNERKK